jgi:hypothetical protein
MDESRILSFEGFADVQSGKSIFAFEEPVPTAGQDTAAQFWAFEPAFTSDVGDTSTIGCLANILYLRQGIAKFHKGNELHQMFETSDHDQTIACLGAASTVS